MNRIIISGNVVKDPEVRVTQSGKSQTRFAVAVRRPYRNTKTGENETDFFNCTDWGGNATYIGKYIRKGNKVIVEGSLHITQYTDRNGEKRTSVDITVASIENLTWQGATRAQTDRIIDQQAPYMTGFKDIAEDLTEQDLPF